MFEEPVYSFTLPSLYDDLRLDCRLYHSRKTAPPHRRGVVIGHPYAPLGGSYDDFVVLALASCLLEEGFSVATFNFRHVRTTFAETSLTSTDGP